MRKLIAGKEICKYRNSFKKSMAVSTILVLLISACSSGGEEAGGGVAGNGSDESAEGHIYHAWITLHVSTRTLDRMLLEYGPEDVIDSFQEPKQELVKRGVLVDDMEEGIRVELDSDEWRESPPGQGTNEIIDPIMVFLGNSEVTWCSEPMDGVTFVREYDNAFYEHFDTDEEYYASMDDYVDCGDGTL